MFNAVKSKVNLLDLIEKELGVTLKECGEDTYAIEDEKEYGGCPACSHFDCFKVKHDVENLEESFFKCFSCEWHGSVIDLIAWKNEISVRDAALKLAKEYNVQLPNDYSPVQEIFELAATYYHNTLLEAKANNILAKMTPLEYQLNVRRHKEGTLKTFNVGWSDGHLISFLEALGYDDEILLESGLKNKKTGKDFLPQNCFIYPHYVSNKVSHFTFKDASKKLAYQLPSKFSLNGFEYYNQDSLKHFETIIIVEGENDLLSVAEHQTKYGVIATIGNASGAQLDWAREHLGSKHVITIFDPDEAGSKYREKFAKIKSAFRSLIQILPPENKDIDELLTSGADLDNLIVNHAIKIEVKNEPPPPTATPTGNSVETEDEQTGNNLIVEKHNIYYRVKYKDGEPTYTMISNFTIILKNVYVTEDGDRLREIVVRRQDGYSSDPIAVNSEAKVSLKSFRVLLARAADADFRGTEQDLINMWELIYAKNTETLVKVTRIVGRHTPSRGWITRDKFISDTGAVVEPDGSGIFWLNGKSVGIRPESLNKNSASDSSDIPKLESNTSPDEREELLKGFSQNLAKNLGDVGNALLMLAWFQSCAYSNTIFKLNLSFPMLFIWGSNGEGKGTICSWLMSIYDLADTGRTAISQIKSGVGLSRKAEYYASLPIWIDEVRSDVETSQYNSMFRSYYDRTARTMGDKNGFGVKVQEVRSCFLFAGEDLFEDPATKERCIVARVPKIGREKTESFQWIENNKGILSSIGFKWLLESVNEDHGKLLTEIKKLDRELILEAKCSSRKSKNWAVVGVFALRMAARFFPNFDMRSYLYKISTEDSELQKSETTVSQFLETVESIMSQEGVPKLTNAHIIRENNLLHIWFPHVYRVVQEAYHGKFSFTKNAILSAMKEEPYFISDNKKIPMGSEGVRRIVLTFDLTRAPNALQNIGLNNHVVT